MTTMAADLHLHAMGDVTEDDLACFFSTTIGSRWFSEPFGSHPCQLDDDYQCAHWVAVADSDDVWIGEVSWLSAGLTGNLNSVPEPVERVADLIGDDLPELTPELREKIIEAVAVDRLRNNGYKTVKPGDKGLITWLNDHLDDRLFTVSW